MPDACTIGIDLGTSAIKGALVSGDGTLLNTLTRHTELQRPGPDQVVFSADLCHAILCDVLRTLAGSHAGIEVKSVCLSGATGDTLLLDKAGRPLLPALHWMDTRSVADPAVDPPGMTPDALYELVGWPWLRMFPLAHLAWLKRHETSSYRQAHRVGMNLTYQFFRLCGAWAIDPSTATTFYLQDQQHRKWHQPFLDWLELSPPQLPEIHPSGSRIGTISPEAAVATGLPEGCAVVLGAFDHPCAARGTGVTAPGDLLLSLGTSWVGFYPIKDRATALRQTMLVDPFLSGKGGEGTWGGMFSLTKAGEKLNESLLLSYPESPDAHARHRRIEQDLRQVMNGQAPHTATTTLLHDLVQAMRGKIDGFSRQGLPAQRIILAGGPSTNGAIVDLFKQIMQRPVEVAPTPGHSGAVGAARLAGASALFVTSEQRSRPLRGR